MSVLTVKKCREIGVKCLLKMHLQMGVTECKQVRPNETDGVRESNLLDLLCFLNHDLCLFSSPYVAWELLSWHGFLEHSAPKLSELGWFQVAVGLFGEYSEESFLALLSKALIPKMCTLLQEGYDPSSRHETARAAEQVEELLSLFQRCGECRCLLLSVELDLLRISVADACYLWNSMLLRIAVLESWQSIKENADTFSCAGGIVV
jgi:hypothetical protein